MPEAQERESLLPESVGLRISGFFVGSANYNSRIQMVPEFAGSAPASSNPGAIDLRFDQLAIGAFHLRQLALDRRSPLRWAASIPLSGSSATMLRST